jgi:hypothetical protein
LTGTELIRNSCRVVVPESIRRAALFPELDLPALPSEHPARRVVVEGVFVRLLPGLPVALVSPERIEESEIDRTVDEVRRFLRLRSARKASGSFRKKLPQRDSLGGCKPWGWCRTTCREWKPVKRGWLQSPHRRQARPE